MKVSSWPPYQIERLRVGLNDLASTVEESRDSDILAWLTRMLVVRSSGYIEQTSREVFRGYVQERAGGLARSFAQSWLEKSRNPSPDNLLDMIGRFDAGLRDEFKQFLEGDDERLRRELALLVDRRNKIAHGLSESIGRDKALLLKEVALEVSEWLVLKFNPLRP